VQWENRDQLDAAHRAPAFRDTETLFSKLIGDVESDFYDLVLIEEK
jgi:hypothetical protein